MVGAGVPLVAVTAACLEVEEAILAAVAAAAGVVTVASVVEAESFGVDVHPAAVLGVPPAATTVAAAGEGAAVAVAAADFALVGLDVISRVEGAATLQSNSEDYSVKMMELRLDDGKYYRQGLGNVGGTLGHWVGTPGTGVGRGCSEMSGSSGAGAAQHLLTWPHSVVDRTVHVTVAALLAAAALAASVTGRSSCIAEEADERKSGRTAEEGIADKAVHQFAAAGAVVANVHNGARRVVAAEGDAGVGAGAPAAAAAAAAVGAGRFEAVQKRLLAAACCLPLFVVRWRLSRCHHCLTPELTVASLGLAAVAAHVNCRYLPADWQQEG